MIDISDRMLWGNEAADDEEPALLNSYFVSRKEWDDFFDTKVSLSIARARKGMGKSALIRESAYRARAQEDTIVISIKGADLVAQKGYRNLSPTEEIHDWQQRICAIINREIGARIGFACTDDSIAMVEAAEISGLKSRNIVGLLLDRMKIRASNFDIKKIGVVDDKALLRRHCHDNDVKIFLLIDDIDETFTNSSTERLRLSTFFTACRDLAANYKGIAIRSAVRSDVWTTIKKSDEALDKVEQYIFDIYWSNKEFRSFLAERIISYCKRIDRKELIADRTKERTIELVFESPFPWGKGTALPHRVIRIYSGGRPRWAAQLCRMAGLEAIDVQSNLIKFGHIKQILEKYGRYRLDDVAREHHHQCSEISVIMNAFVSQSRYFTTAQLCAYIENSILSNIDVVIERVAVTEAVILAHYLYKIGFFLAFKQQEGSTSEYFSFEDKPELLKNKSNYDDGMTWYIHPSFHVALSLQ